MKIEKLTGTIDVIGLDVLKAPKIITTEKEAKALIKDASRETFDMIEVDGETFIIRTMIADLNRLTSVIPEDLERNQAIKVQVKIAEILQRAGINVGVNDNIDPALKETLEQMIPANNPEYEGHPNDVEVAADDELAAEISAEVIAESETTETK